MLWWFDRFGFEFELGNSSYDKWNETICGPLSMYVMGMCLCFIVFVFGLTNAV